MNNKIRTKSDLLKAIQILDEERKEHEIGLKEQFKRFSESVTPINIIKSSLKSFSITPELTNGLLGTTVGLATGYVSKKIFVGASNNPLKRLLGTALMYGVTSIVSRNPDKIKSVGKGIWQIIRNKTKNSPSDNGSISQE